MIETIINFKERSEWREGMTYEKLMAEMETALQVPGLVNSWTYPIRGRIDMLLSGIRTPLGIKLYGSSAEGLQNTAKKIESTLRGFDKTLSVFADQAGAGYYIDIGIDKEALARYGLNEAALLQYTASAIGGMQVTTMYKGLERYPVALRYEENGRRTPESIGNILIKTKLGFVPLHTFSKIGYRESASVVKSEKATPVTFVYITPREGVSATAYKAEAKQLVDAIELPEGFYVEWAGQSEYLESAMAKIVWIVPVTLLLIFLLIYLALKETVPTLIVFFALPLRCWGDCSISISWAST